MTKSREWKETFRDGMFACRELRSKKAHRTLLEYLVHRANRKNRFCWPSQVELARVQNCSVRNIKDQLDYLVDLGAIHSVRITDLPKRDKETIKLLTPNKITRNANAYYVCEAWAQEILDDAPVADSVSASSTLLRAADQAKGRRTANEKRQRYAPLELVHESSIAPNPDLDEWQILNAMPSETGSPTSPLNRGLTGSPTTDMTNEYKPAEISVPNNGAPSAAFAPSPSKANPWFSISSPPHQRADQPPHGYGGGEASACDPSPPGLARPEGTEYDAAGARANYRRAS